MLINSQSFNIMTTCNMQFLLVANMKLKKLAILIASLDVLSMWPWENISHPSSVLFSNPTHKTKTGTTWQTTNSKAPGPIIMTGLTNQKQGVGGRSYLLHSSALPFTASGVSKLCKNARPFRGAKGACLDFSSSNFNGRVTCWELGMLLETNHCSQYSNSRPRHTWSWGKWKQKARTGIHYWHCKCSCHLCAQVHQMQASSTALCQWSYYPYWAYRRMHLSWTVITG
jgi:hypothetical protein